MSNVTPLNTDQSPSGDELCELYRLRKIELETAKAKFAAIEQRIIDQIGHKEEGSFSVRFDNFKATTTGKVTRSVDPERIWNVKANVSDDLFDLLFTFKPSLNLAAYRKLQDSNPDTYNIVASCITAKPAKPALKVEPVEAQS